MPYTAKNTGLLQVVNFTACFKLSTVVNATDLLQVVNFIQLALSCQQVAASLLTFLC